MNATHRPHFAATAFTAGIAAGALYVAAVLTLDVAVATAGLILTMAAFLACRVRHNLKHLPTPEQANRAALASYAAMDRADRDF